MSYIRTTLGKKISGGVTNAVQLGGTGNDGKLSLEVRHFDSWSCGRIGFLEFLELLVEMFDGMK
jgi:hypothetical protein